MNERYVDLVRRLAALTLLAGVANAGPRALSAQAGSHSGHGAADTVDHSRHTLMGSAVMGGATVGDTTVDSAEISDESIYNLEGLWHDQHESARPLSSLTGKAQVVAMVYTHCGYSCPQILMELKRIEGSFTAEELTRVGFVLVSVDPERDTPERLAEFAESARLDPERWTLLTGSDDQVLEVAAVLGVKLRRLPDGEFAHSNLLTVLDQGGVIVHRHEGVGLDVGNTVEAVAGLLGR